MQLNHQPTARSINLATPDFLPLIGTPEGGRSAIITAAEYSPELVPPHHPNERVRHLGDANVWVSNVGVHGDDGTPNNGVEFIINVDFPRPLFVVVDISVLDSEVAITHF